MGDDDLLDLLRRTADAVADAFADHRDWGPSGRRDDQYASDLVADAAALAVLEPSGLAIVSEESGRTEGVEPTIVVDPLDGSTNASRSLPWFATSLCAVDDQGPRVAVVHDHGSSVRYDAVRGRGARRDGVPLPRRTERDLGDAIVVINGLPGANPGWAQFRCYGASALDLCAVADGRFDGFVDYDGDALAPWDYLGGMLVCREVGVEVVDVEGRALSVTEHSARRTPVAAPPGLLAALLESRPTPTTGPS